MRRDDREKLRDKVLAPVFRWGFQRKREALGAILMGSCTRDELMKAHGITSEEIDGWWRAFLLSGVTGLKQLECRPRRRTWQ